jgi:hypothetical protein
MALKGKTLGDACSTSIEGENKWKTLKDNAMAPTTRFNIYFSVVLCTMVKVYRIVTIFAAKHSLETRNL